MLELLIKVVMYIIQAIASIIVTPISSLIFAAFPSLGTYFNYFSAYLVMGLRYVPTVLAWFCIPQNAVAILFEYYALKFTLYIGLSTYKFIVRIYDKFKP